jgi:hypothetical protein
LICSGSLWQYDIVTIVVQESASAVSTGQTKTFSPIESSKQYYGAGGRQPGLWHGELGGETTLDGEGTTARTMTLTTTGRVTHVLRNGNEPSLKININTENQTITVRGVIRPIDLDTTNSVQSARLAQMEIQAKWQRRSASRRSSLLNISTNTIGITAVLGRSGNACLSFVLMLAPHWEPMGLRNCFPLKAFAITNSLVMVWLLA